MPRKTSLAIALDRAQCQTISLSDRSAENAARLAPHWPHTIKKFRRLLRRRLEEAVRRGVVIRVGSELILNVPAYLSWLATFNTQVLDFVIAPNTDAHKHKRFGGAARHVQEPDGI